MTIPLQVIVLPLKGISDAERRATPRPQASTRLLLTVERKDSLRSILQRIEEWYKRDYLTPKAARLFVIKSISNSLNFDIDIKANVRFDQLFNCDRPDIDQVAVIKVTQGVLSRESSSLSQTSAQRSHHGEATSQNASNRKRRYDPSASPPNKRRRISRPSPVLVPSTPRESQQMIPGSSPPRSISAYAQSEVLGGDSPPVIPIAETQIVADLPSFSDNGKGLANSSVAAEEERVSEDEYGENLFSDAVTEMLDRSSQVGSQTPAGPSIPAHRRTKGKEKAREAPAAMRTPVPPPSSQISSQPASSPGPRRNNTKEKSHWQPDEDKTARYVMSCIKDRSKWEKFLPGRSNKAILTRVARLERGEGLIRQTQKSQNAGKPRKRKSRAGLASKKTPKSEAKKPVSASPVESIPSPEPMKLPKRMNPPQRTASTSKTEGRQPTRSAKKTNRQQTPEPIQPDESASAQASDPIEITSEESSEDDGGDIDDDDADGVDSEENEPAAAGPSRKPAADRQVRSRSPVISILSKQPQVNGHHSSRSPFLQSSSTQDRSDEEAADVEQAANDEEGSDVEAGANEEEDANDEEGLGGEEDSDVEQATDGDEASDDEQNSDDDQAAERSPEPRAVSVQPPEHESISPKVSRNQPASTQPAGKLRPLSKPLLSRVSSTQPAINGNGLRRSYSKIPMPSTQPTAKEQGLTKLSSAREPSPLPMTNGHVSSESPASERSSRRSSNDRQTPARTSGTPSASAQLLSEANPPSASPSGSRASSTQPLSEADSRSASPEVQIEEQRRSSSVAAADQMDSMQPPRRRLSSSDDSESEAASTRSPLHGKSPSTASTSEGASTPTPMPTPRLRRSPSATSVAQMESMQPPMQRQSSPSSSASEAASTHSSQHKKSPPMAPTYQVESTSHSRQRQCSTSSSGSEVASTQSSQHEESSPIASLDEVTSMPPPPRQRQSSSTGFETQVTPKSSPIRARDVIKAPQAQLPSTQPLNRTTIPSNPFTSRPISSTQPTNPFTTRQVPSTQPTTITAWRAQHALDIEATRKAAAAERRSSEASISNANIPPSSAPGRKRPEGLDELKPNSDDSDSESEGSDKEDSATIFQRMYKEARTPLQGLCRRITKHGYGSLR